MDQPDIEKEVKRLFRADAEAISVKWELITDDDKGANGKMEGSGGPGTSGSFKRTDTAASLDIGKGYSCKYGWNWYR
jgi:transcription initiation factor TFIID subunit 7